MNHHITKINYICAKKREFCSTNVEKRRRKRCKIAPLSAEKLLCRFQRPGSGAGCFLVKGTAEQPRNVES